MIIDSPIISGSLASTGSLTQIGNVVITGSLSVSGPIKGNITGSADSASFATTSSYAVSASFATTAVTSSYPFTLSGSVLYTTTGVPYLSKNYNRPTISIGKNIGSGSFLLYSDPGYNVYIGHEVATFTTESSDTVAIGTQAASQLVGGYAFATMVGSYTGFEGYELGESVLIGYSAGNNLLDGYQVTVVGEDAAYGGRKLDRATLIGNSAGAGTNTGSFSTAVGYNAFSYADKSIGSVFLGAWAGNDLISGSNSIIIGPYSGRNVTLKRNNIIIGTNVSLPTNAQDSINIGGLIFGTGSAWVGVDPTYDDYNANPFTGSANGKIGINQPTPLYSFDVSGSGNYTNGLTVTGSIVATSVTSSLLGTASYAVNANFLDNLDSTSFVYTSSYNVDSSSFSTRVTNTEATASSLVTASGSFSNRVTIIESSYATTGSNLFSGTQGINSIANAISFTSTASLYTDGGARITKDLYVSGTSYFNNVTIYGTQSVQYITSSQLNIGTNIITVNTDTPTVRYGGLAVYDSGSTGLTGSLLWDSEANHWIYTNPSGSTYSGGMMISGPRASARGCEQGTTSCALMMGQGGDHITSSAIFHYGNATCFYGNTTITSTGVGCFAGTVCAPSFISSGTICSTGNTCFGGMSVVASCLGVGTSTPQRNLDVFASSCNIPAASFGGNIAIGEWSGIGFGYEESGNSNYRKAALVFERTGAAAEGRIHILNNSAADISSATLADARLTIASTGIACFACQVCMPVLLASGCVGIGTTAPGSPLEIYSSNVFNTSTGANPHLIINYNSATAGGPAIKFSRVGISDWSAIQADLSGGTRTLKFIQTASGVASTQMVINANDGNVGIGTTSPCYKLDVSADINDGSIIRAVNLNSGAAATARFYAENNIGSLGQLTTYSSGFGFTVFGLAAGNYSALLSSGASSAGLLIGSLTSSPVVFGTNNIERLRITSTGIACFACQVCAASFNAPEVNIGTSLSGYALTVKEKGCTSAPFIAFVGSTSNGSWMRSYWFCSDATTTLAQLTVQPTDNMYFGSLVAMPLILQTNNSSRLTIASTGAACFACELTAKSLGTNDLILNNLNHEHANYVDGTRGSWLIQEGACDLFIINQVSCKKYKFNLIEIE